MQAIGNPAEAALSRVYALLLEAAAIRRQRLSQTAEPEQGDEPADEQADGQPAGDEPLVEELKLG